MVLNGGKARRDQRIFQLGRFVFIISENSENKNGHKLTQASLVSSAVESIIFHSMNKIAL